MCSKSWGNKLNWKVAKSLVAQLTHSGISSGDVQGSNPPSQPFFFFFPSKKDELEREEENQGSADMTNGRHVRVGPRHPLDTAACVSA